MNAESKTLHATAADTQTPATPPRKTGRRLLIAAVPLVLMAGGAAAWVMGGRYVTTDNAYVHQPMVSISADVSGRISEVLVGENQHVAAGAPLFRIDAEPYRIALAEAEAALASARLQVASWRANYAIASAQLEAAQSILDVQNRELDRQRTLTERGIGSQAALDAATVTARNASNSVMVARRQLDAAAAALGGDPEIATDALPSVKAAIAHRDAAARNLAKTEVLAPAEGAVAQIESLNVGQFLSTGTIAATLVQDSTSWVEANFKETQLAALRPGQSVEVEVDAYPGLSLHGQVESFSSATGSQFSLIPAQNATGNWVKVVQRVPVRIQLDESCDCTLRDGMSVGVSVDTGHSRLDGLR